MVENCDCERGFFGLISGCGGCCIEMLAGLRICDARVEVGGVGETGSSIVNNL